MSRGCPLEVFAKFRQACLDMLSVEFTVTNELREGAIAFFLVAVDTGLHEISFHGSATLAYRIDVVDMHRIPELLAAVRAMGLPAEFRTEQVGQPSHFFGVRCGSSP